MSTKTVRSTTTTCSSRSITTTNTTNGTSALKTTTTTTISPDLRSPALGNTRQRVASPGRRRTEGRRPWATSDLRSPALGNTRQRVASPGRRRTEGRRPWATPDLSSPALGNTRQRVAIPWGRRTEGRRPWATPDLSSPALGNTRRRVAGPGRRRTEGRRPWTTPDGGSPALGDAGSEVAGPGRRRTEGRRLWATPDGGFAVASEKGLFSVVFNFQLPGSTHYSMVFYFITKELVPGSLLQRFVDGDDEFRNSRLKLITTVPKGSWIVRQSVGSTPCLLGKAVDCNYIREPKYLEIDVDIGSSTVANGVLGIVIGVVTTLVFDMAFLVQANTTDELPERLIGAIFSLLEEDFGQDTELPSKLGMVICKGPKLPILLYLKVYALKV
ncbi:hypothetical protein NL676_010966 [Syzygium grande]|nr:hypothetical protein NL676_010966 [Syzygium grande]